MAKRVQKEFGSGTQSYFDKTEMPGKEKMKQRKRKGSVNHMKVESKWTRGRESASAHSPAKMPRSLSVDHNPVVYQNPEWLDDRTTDVTIAKYSDFRPGSYSAKD